MSVVQRCPNCGTTRATPGECEACHEAQVRYFCTNHEPGLWLDARTCPTCDARLRDAARRPSAPPSGGPVRRSAAPARVPASTSPRPLPYALPDPPRPEVGWTGHERLRPADEEALEVGAFREPLWQKILRAAVLARAMRPKAAPDRERTSFAQLGGCVMRLLLIAVVLIVALVTALYLFGRAVL